MKDEQELSIGNRWLEVGKVIIFLTEQRHVKAPRFSKLLTKYRVGKWREGRSADGDLVKNRAWNTL